MNSKERVTACIRREPADSVPMGFYMVDHDTISRVIGRPTYVRNSVALQLAYWEGRRDEVVESMKADIVDFYEKMDLCDIITFKEAAQVPPKGYKPDPPRKISDEIYEDKQGRVYKLSVLSNEFIIVKDPAAEKAQYTLEQFQIPDRKPAPPDPSTLEVYDHMVNHFKDTRYIAGLTGGSESIFMKLGGMERGLMEYILDPDMVKAAAERTSWWADSYDAYYYRPGIGGAFMETDICSTTGPLLSPDMFREFGLTHFKRRIENLRKIQPDIQILFHSCGNSRKLLDMFIEAGVQVYQSIQSIPEMELGDLKKDWGDRLIFWGGAPVEELILGTPEGIRKAVRKSMEAAAPGGGFILGPSHSIAYGTKYENFMAMLDEFNKLRFKFRGI